MDEPVWYKDGYFWRKESEPWEIREWMFVVDSLGDLIHHTLKKIIEDNDTSAWAYMSFNECANLLTNGKRWHDRMEEKVYNKDYWKRHFPILKRFYFKKATWYRSQYSITRDPHILLRACAVHLGIDQDLLPKIPLRLYTPKVWSWCRALEGKRNLYRYWRRFPTSKKNFVTDLNNIMEEAYEKVK